MESFGFLLVLEEQWSRNKELTEERGWASLATFKTLTLTNFEMNLNPNNIQTLLYNSYKKNKNFYFQTIDNTTRMPICQRCRVNRKPNGISYKTTLLYNEVSPTTDAYNW